MKTKRFNLLTAIFAVLISVSSANAQLAELAEMGIKLLMNESIKNKEAREKIKEIQPTYEAWLESLMNYYSKTDKVGDCKTIGFRHLSNNRDETPNFSYECGVDGSIAFLYAKNKIKIGNCDRGSVFKLEFDRKYRDFRIFSFPINNACVFFQKSAWLIPSDPSVIIESSGGSRSNGNIKVVPSMRARELKNIYYDKYLQLKPGFSGKITLKFTIAPSGEIVSISTVSSTTGYSDFDNTIKNMVATWKWKAIESGNTTATITFNFFDENFIPKSASSIDINSSDASRSKAESQTSGKIELGGRRGSAIGGFNVDGYAEGGSDGIGDMMGGLKGGGGLGSGISFFGSRSRAEVMAVVNARMPELKNRYNNSLNLKPGFNGKVTLKFTIAPSGEIVSISIVSSTTGYAKFDNDVKNMVATWKWKVIESGNTTATIPFNFTE